jgi:hypothetical protein
LKSHSVYSISPKMCVVSRTAVYNWDCSEYCLHSPSQRLLLH